MIISSLSEQSSFNMREYRLHYYHSFYFYARKFLENYRRKNRNSIQALYGLHSIGFLHRDVKPVKPLN